MAADKKAMLRIAGAIVYGINDDNAYEELQTLEEDLASMWGKKFRDAIAEAQREYDEGEEIHMRERGEV